MKIHVPATSANIGPGFDCFGMAFDLYNIFEVTEEDNDNVNFSGFAPEYCNTDNLVFTSFVTAANMIGYNYKGLSMSIIDEKIPCSRGLGSSSTCVVAGVMAADNLAGSKMSKRDILDIAAGIEGHPDNVAPAIYGGMVAAVNEGTKFFTQEVKVADGLKFFAFVPEFELETSKARAVLPKEVPLSDAIFNIGRASMLLNSLSRGDFEILSVCLNDKIHQPYRAKLIEGYDDMVRKCKENGSIGAFLSGAGPIIMAVCKYDDENFYNAMTKELKYFKNNWRIIELNINKTGAFIEN